MVRYEADLASTAQLNRREWRGFPPPQAAGSPIRAPQQFHVIIDSYQHIKWQKYCKSNLFSNKHRVRKQQFQNRAFFNNIRTLY
jgi:hypothetical protein